MSRNKNIKIKINTNYLCLLIGLMMLFVILNLVHNSNSMYIDLYGKREKVNEDILTKENNEYYISYTYIKENIDDEIYFDGISKKVVISSKKGLLKARVNDDAITVNFNNVEIENIGVIEKEDKYVSLEVLEEAYEFDITVCNNTIYVHSANASNGKAKSNNTAVYTSNNLKSEIAMYVDKKNKISIISEYDNFVFIKTKDNKVGYVQKKLLKYKIEEKENEENSEKNNVYIFTDSLSGIVQKGLPLDGVIVDMFEVTQVSTVINQTKLNQNLLNSIRDYGYKLYGMIDNGYNLSTFNTSTMSQILSDETKRLNLINNINAKIKEHNLNGIVLDFRAIKEKDIDGYIQFIKELKAFCQKEVILNINASEYKNYLDIINYSDFAIINAYGQRDLKSTVAGSISEIKWMENILKDSLKKATNEKVVAGLPAYSILWTEKDSNVVNSEIYSMKAMQDYIKKNSLETKEINGQNYVELKKGSLLYRMWVEDEVSIKNRLEIVKNNNLKGVAIYKLGYENDNLINSLKNF